MILLAALALQTLPSPRLERWTVVQNQDGTEFAVDRQSISRSGTRASVVVRGRTPNAEGPAIGVVRYVYDCAAGTVTRDISDVYDIEGHFLGSVDTPQPSRPITPRSLQAALRDEVCGAPAR